MSKIKISNKVAIVGINRDCRSQSHYILSVLYFTIRGRFDLFDLLCFNATFSNISAISWRLIRGREGVLLPY